MRHDLRVAIRRLRNAPGFASVAVLTLALAIGANTAIFSVADTVLFKRLPYADPDRVYTLATLNSKTQERSRAVPSVYLQALSERHGGLSEIGLRGPTTMTTHVAVPAAEWMETFAVTPAYFRVLGVRPHRGRLFEEHDTLEPGRAAVLTYEAWQHRFAGDEQVVGRAVTLGTDRREIIGILPSGFIFPTASLRFLYNPTGRPEFLTVMSTRSAEGQQKDPFRAYEEPVVRLQDRVTRAQVQAEIDAVVAGLQTSRNEVVVLESPRAVMFPSGRAVMTFLVAAAAAVLLIGCANLAGMLLARTRRREREIGLHAALGATRLRIVRPIVLETLIVGCAAAIVALAVTAVSFDLLLRQVPPSAYGSAYIRFDERIALFAIALGLGSGVGFAVLPAWWSARLDVQTLIHGRRSSGRRLPSVERPAIAFQVCLAIVLLFCAAIASRSFVSVLRIPLGFSPDKLIAINARPDERTSPVDFRGFYEHAAETLARRTDVVAAGAAGSIPADGFRAPDTIDAPGQPSVDILYALPGYLETIGIPLTRGRYLAADDLHGGESAAVLGSSAAHALFPDRSPIGATFRSRQGRTFTVVGIVGDVRRNVSVPMPPAAYVFPPPDSNRGMTIVARMRYRKADTLTGIRREIAALTPASPVTAVWWSESIDAQAAYRNPRFQTLVLGTFAALALGLTALGIFAAVASAVTMRTREMGVRLALGAHPRALVRLVISQALTPVVLGIVGGVAATQWLRRVAEAQLFDVNARDPLTIAIAAFVVAAAALLAAYLPARHASRVDPIEVLRADAP